MMKLRTWQSECVELAITKYESGVKHFLAMAIPGAGKTYMSSELVERLFKNDLIDLVFCFSPSTIISQDFSLALHLKLNERFDGLLGSKGQSLTYQSMQYLNDDFWSLFEKYRVFVIFDEIHHCSGSDLKNANAWGEQIILNIQDRAIFTLALTGTPWRTDSLPVVLSRYSMDTKQIECDFVYGLSQGIKDSVCRIPQIIAIDNNHISVTEKNERKLFCSFNDLLSQSLYPYQNIIENEDVILHVLQLANKKLEKICVINPDAGGLIVASSVEHAHQISSLLVKSVNEKAVIVTYRENEPTQLIKQFRNSRKKWIISVGMISEGTNIPRLQVCCHLTNIKTEMHFRQTLGRILRMTQAVNQEAILYMPAAPKLVEYACRVGDDMPAGIDIVEFEKMSNNYKEKHSSKETKSQAKKPNLDDDMADFEDFESSLTIEENNFNEESFLSSFYEKNMVDVFGEFNQETLSHNLLPLS